MERPINSHIPQRRRRSVIPLQVHHRQVRLRLYPKASAAERALGSRDRHALHPHREHQSPTQHRPRHGYQERAVDVIRILQRVHHGHRNTQA